MATYTHVKSGHLLSLSWLRNSLPLVLSESRHNCTDHNLFTHHTVFVRDIYTYTSMARANFTTCSFIVLDLGVRHWSSLEQGHGDKSLEQFDILILTLFE